jgi:hypothetical protein
MRLLASGQPTCRPLASKQYTKLGLWSTGRRARSKYARRSPLRVTSSPAADTTTSGRFRFPPYGGRHLLCDVTFGSGIDIRLKYKIKFSLRWISMSQLPHIGTTGKCIFGKCIVKARKASINQYLRPAVISPIPKKNFYAFIIT